jgi:hypothetical protein
MTKFKWTLNMIIAAPMILICSIILAGGGHGFPDQLIVLFPWTFISNIINSQFFFVFWPYTISNLWSFVRYFK